MPGPPRRMAKRVTEVERRAAGLLLDFYNLIPETHLKQRNLNNALGRAWSLALSAAVTATRRLGDLAPHLRQRAGVPEPKPIVRLPDTEEEAVDSRLVEWLERRGGEASVRYLRRGLWAYRYEPLMACEALEVLREAGLGDWVVLEPGPRGGRRSLRFRLHRSIDTDETHAEVQHNRGCVDVEGGQARRSVDAQYAQNQAFVDAEGDEASEREGTAEGKTGGIDGLSAMEKAGE